MLHSSGKQTNLLKITVEKYSSLIGHIYSLETVCRFLNSLEAALNVFRLYSNVLRNRSWQASQKGNISTLPKHFLPSHYTSLPIFSPVQKTPKKLLAFKL